jgi:hypothetical protein
MITMNVASITLKNMASQELHPDVCPLEIALIWERFAVTIAGA